MFGQDILGTAAAILTTASFLPQAIRVLQTGDTRAISLAMYALFTAGVALWIVYGAMLDSLPIIISNAITFVLAATILVQKVRHTRPSAREG